MNATGYGDVAEALLHFLRRVMGTGRGLPQGLMSSDSLATVYLAEVDFAMIRNGYRYVRHGDDVRVAVDTYDQGCLAIRCMEAELRKCGLLLNSEKTRVFHRQTYHRSLSLFEETWTKAKGRVVEGMAAEFRENQQALKAAMDKFDMEELGWALFYHQAIDLEEAIEELRKGIEPEDVEIAEMLFRNTIRRRPRERNEGRPRGFSSAVDRRSGQADRGQVGRGIESCWGAADFVSRQERGSMRLHDGVTGE